MNRSKLVLRDPALGSLTGAIPGADFGAEYDDFGNDAGGSAAPTPAALMDLWNRTQARKGGKGGMSIERYTFTVNDDIVLGTAGGFTMSGSPSVTIQPERLTINAPTVGFARISDIKVANTSATLGGEEDAFNYNANGVGQALDMKVLSPSTQASIVGTYTGYVPTGFTTATAYRLAGTFKGPANVR